MIIGLTGRNCSGKGEVAAFLKKAGYIYFSLSDAIRIDLQNSRKEVTRDSLTKRGNELRKEFGPAILAERILGIIPAHANAIVDSIRNPAEVEALRSRHDFFLIEVFADPKIRFERQKARSREGDPKTYEEFLRCEERESDGQDLIKQQLDLTAKLSDAVVKNEGNLDDLYCDLRQTVASFSRLMKRPSFDEYFMEIARVVSLRGNCVKRKVGAVIVREKRIISTGYNGTPRGAKNCYEGGCKRCNALAPSGEDLGTCICSHAEENSIVQAAYHGVSTKGATIYTTFSPCIMCSKMIINSGISEVVYSQAYSIEEEPLALLKEAGVAVRKLAESK